MPVRFIDLYKKKVPHSYYNYNTGKNHYFTYHQFGNFQCYFLESSFCYNLAEIQHCLSNSFISIAVGKNRTIDHSNRAPKPAIKKQLSFFFDSLLVKDLPLCFERLFVKFKINLQSVVLNSCK